MIRKIIEINEEKCNGCGACAAACHEGAIGMVNGKAKLLRDDYCDGLGDCLPTCPTGAIRFVEREAAAYDEQAVRENQMKKQATHSGCPGRQMQQFNRQAPAPSAAAPLPSQLGQWPCQIKLIPVNAPCFDGAKLLIAADCTAYAYANLHQDLDIEDYYMYEGAFAKDGWMEWHDGTAAHSIPLAAGGDNPELDFITRQEFRVGLDATLFDRLLRINVNYFRNDMKGLLTQGASTIYPSYFKLSDNNSFLSWTNYNEDRRSGFDFSVAANRKFGEFDVTLGFSGMVYASTALKRDETYEFDYQYREGRPIDASYGYVCEGFFESQEEIDNSGIRQTFGTVRPGDLKYKDINGDGVIDSDDQIDLGKSGSGASPFSFGLNLNVKYRNWSLFAMGTGRTGAIGYKNSSYYWNKGTSKFSEVVWGRWTEETKEFANYPRLTTGDGSNNYRNSTFWMYKNNYFNLDQVQLTYDFPAKPFRKIPFVSGLSVYCGGTSLLTISKEREHKEMNVGGAPYCRNYYIGLKASF